MATKRRNIAAFKRLVAEPRGVTLNAACTEAVSLHPEDVTFDALEDIMKALIRCDPEPATANLRLSTTVRVAARMMRSLGLRGRLSLAAAPPKASDGSDRTERMAAWLESMAREERQPKFGVAAELLRGIFFLPSARAAFPYPFNGVNQCYKNAILVSVFKLQSAEAWRAALPSFNPQKEDGGVYSALVSLSRNVRHVWNAGCEQLNYEWMRKALSGAEATVDEKKYGPEVRAANIMCDPLEFLDSLVDSYPNANFRTFLAQRLSSGPLGRPHIDNTSSTLFDHIETLREFAFVHVGYGVLDEHALLADGKSYDYSFPALVERGAAYETTAQSGEVIRYRPVACVVKQLNARHYGWAEFREEGGGGRWRVYDGLNTDVVVREAKSLRGACGKWEWQPYMMLTKTTSTLSGGAAKNSRYRAVGG